MAFLDGVKDKVAQASQSALQKTKELSELAKLNNAIVEAERKISELYGDIGYEIYRCHSQNSLPEIDTFITMITELHDTIEACQAQIKAINNAHLCTNCGAKISKDVTFCSTCGIKLTADEILDTCGSCGGVVAPESAFCTSCGAKIL